MKKGIIIIITAMAVTAVSCHIFDDRTTTDNVTLYFQESNVSVFEGGMGAVTLRVEPQEAVTNNTVSWEIGNEEIAVIYRADKRSCTFYGMAIGSTILRAKLKDAEVQMVISVIPPAKP